MKQKSKIKCVIDVGTNSIKFLLAEKTEARPRILDERSDITRLGEGLRETGAISPAAMERNAEAIANYARIAREWGAEEISTVGTMAVRTAKNASAFLELVKRRAGVELRVIDGKEEARLAHIGACSSLPVSDSDGDKNLLVFDTGGGSTEFIYGRGAVPDRSFSVPIGAIWLTEEFFRSDPVEADSVEKAEALVREEFLKRGVKQERDTPLLIGIGGAVTTLAYVRDSSEGPDGGAVHGASLSEAIISAQIKDYAGKTIEERKKIPGLPPKRADIVLAGACIVRVVMNIVGAHTVTVSSQGLRHGLMQELMRH
ncbi:phosphatase [Synergistales bacterium]|nr:phosphatase [Synergistales bacterium]